jgi:hypothetical protein
MFDDTRLRKTHKKAVIIAAAMMITPLIYVGLAEFLLRDTFPSISFPFYGKLRYFIIAAAAIEIIVMSIVKNLIISGEIKIDKVQFHRKKEEKTETGEEEFIRRLFRAFFVSYSVWDSIAFFGLILFILGKNSTELYAFVGAAIFMMMVHFPRYDDWESRLKDFLEVRNG